MTVTNFFYICENCQYASTEPQTSCPKCTAQTALIQVSEAAFAAAYHNAHRLNALARKMHRKECEAAWSGNIIRSSELRGRRMIVENRLKSVFAEVIKLK